MRCLLTAGTRLHRERGYSLREVMIALLIVGTLALMALPLLMTMVAARQVKIAVFDFYLTLTYARSEAIKRNSLVTIKPERGNFANGYDVEAKSGVLSRQPAIRGVAITAGSDVPLAFNGYGRLPTPGIYPLEFRSTFDTSIRKSCIVVGLSGRASMPTEGGCIND